MRSENIQNLQIRNSTPADLAEILRIYSEAREFMRDNGNPTQWSDWYPPREIIERDIQSGTGYVCVENGEIQAVFYYNIERDPTYEKIDGAWLNDKSCGVIHRIAKRRKAKGAGEFCINWCLEQCGNIKIDTHKDNIPMQKLLKKLGFTSCGIIWVLDGEERQAFQKCSIFNEIKAVLWDLDGVLIDSEPGYNITVGELIRSLGYKFGEAEIAKTTGASYKNIAELLGLDEPKEKIERLYIEALLKAINQNVTALIDGAGGFLQELKSRKIKMAIGSSSPRVLVEQIVNKFGLSEFIDIIVTGSDAERGKPAPDIYLKCAELLGVEPANCLVIEDSLNGIKAAKNAAMRVLAFTGTALHNFDLSAADFQIDAYNSDTFKVIEHLLSL